MTSQLPDSLGGIIPSVEKILAFSRLCWHAALNTEQKADIRYDKIIYNRAILQNNLPKELNIEDFQCILSHLSDYKDNKVRLCSYDENAIYLHDTFLHPLTFVRVLLRHTCLDHDLRYYVNRSIWRYYGYTKSSKTIHYFQILSRAASKACATASKQKYKAAFLPLLEHAVRTESAYTEMSINMVSGMIEFFLESCRVAGYITLSKDHDVIDIRTKLVDAEYLLSNLYGLPTGIRGFDDLFGGGGLQFYENLEQTQPSDNFSGRIIVIKGPFGTGKSLLSLQLGVEVARKGGVVLAIPLEQSAREAVYVLESMGCLPEASRVLIVQDQLARYSALAKKSAGNCDYGVLAFLETSKSSYKDFLALLVEKAERLRPNPLRLLIIDPTNSICDKGEPEDELRAEAAQAFEAIRKMGTNLILVAEKAADSRNEFWFEENIADTVIHLSTVEMTGYTQRRFEIVKSRFQREQRGSHPFSIISGEGVHIYPSSASVLARMQSRSMREPDKGPAISFGLPCMDKVLGPKALTIGDVVVFKGPDGSMKTHLGILFLLGSDQPAKVSSYQSLFVSVRDSEGTIRHMLNQPFVERYRELNPSHSKCKEQIRICAIPSGHINPGYIFQRLEDELTDARRQGMHVDRIMIDSVSHWEMSCPLIRGDETFGDTLLDFLRRQGVTSLLICDPTMTDKASVLQHSVIDGADCTIVFDRIEFRGVHRVMLRAIQTRSMNHRRESFELGLVNNEIQVLPTTSLLRVGRSGETGTINIMLFLHYETDAQKRYNTSFQEAVQAVLSPSTKVVPQDRIYMSKVMTLGPTSVVDELQVMQLDEFQLPRVAADDRRDIILHPFNQSEWLEKDWGDFLEALRKRCWTTIQNSKQFVAVPFYENISLIAHHKSISASVATSWHHLADACKRWESENHKGLFFDFPRITSENYNCLFIEILLSLQAEGEKAQFQPECLLNLLHSEKAVIAAELFRTLCRRAYLAHESNVADSTTMGNDGTTFEVSQTAMVWRHWYSTLNQMMSKLHPLKRSQIIVRSLPKNVAVAGEWYLGIPAYSAAPDVGLDIIRLLTTKEAESNRLRLGVGLPTRKTFYESGNGIERQRAEISPYFSIDMGLREVRDLIDNAFRRSNSHCYRKISQTLTYYLKKIIEVPGKSPKSVRSDIQDLLINFRGSEEFMSSDWDCGRCPHKKSKLPSDEL